MKIYLAGGGITGNLQPFLNETLEKVEKGMNVFLAGEHEVKNGTECATWDDINILESFYYASQNKHVIRLIKSAKNFLLDSGAFTFMQNSKEQVDWDKYIENFAKFINTFDVKLFFELDIDPIVGLQEVERLRHKLEELTGKKPIPVWHKNRSKQYFIDMCKEYPYVALGGIVTQEIPRKKYESAFPWFIKTAHEHGAKIHGLGYTSLRNLSKYHFDSIDSTSWLSGNRAGNIFIFNRMTGEMKSVFTGEGQRLKPRAAAKHNFCEWVKFSKYAEIYY